MKKEPFLLMITKVKNEADIIETFLRYHANIFDLIVLIDNGSIDGTYEITNKLIEEGLNIEFLNEANSDFDALRFANQYNKFYVEKTAADYVVFMDADEFLISLDGRNPRDAIVALDKNVVHYVKWKTYLYNEKTDGNLLFSFDGFEEYRAEDKEVFTKVIVPGHFFLEDVMIIAEGNHSFKSTRTINTEHNKEIKFAHFPIRSKAQYRKQIILNSICMLSVPDEKKQTGSHWKKMFMTEEADLEELSLKYAFYEGTTREKGKFIDVFNVQGSLRYFDNIQSDSEYIFLKYMEIQALKLKKERIEISEKRGAEKILIYGTGSCCDRLVGRLDENLYKIEAFVDSDIEKQFSMYRGNIIIAPDKMRFFDFSLILVATDMYTDEIKTRIMQELPYYDVKKIIGLEQFIVSSYNKGKGC